MKVIAYTALHYGIDYLYWSVKSVIDHVDEYVVLYSAEGSHGTHSDVRCPESRQQLYVEAKSAAGDKLRWIDGLWAHEGLQRESIHEYAPDADVILVVDADEIWPARTVALAREAPIGMGIEPRRVVRLPMIHFWRSFRRAVLHDSAFPGRIIYPKIATGECSIGFTDVGGSNAICHMGYAQRPDIVYYKQLVHGHRGEWRPDWYDTRFAVNAQRDCHPVNVNYWNPEPVNPWNYLPEFMKDHPYADVEVIT